MRTLYYVVGLAGLVAQAGLAAEAVTASAPVLTNAAQIRSLSAPQTAEARPVRLCGVVMDKSDPPDRAVIIADATAGIYVLAATNLFASYRQGDVLEVTGVTDPGEFAPIVRASTVSKLGTARNPPPQVVSYQQLITGAMDAQWVEISGVIRRCLEPVGTDVWRIVISANGGQVPVRWTGSRPPGIQEDAEVRVQAICLYQFNQKRQALTPILQIPAGVPIIVEKSAPADPFAEPLRTADSLSQFAPESFHAHRLHLQGVVTHAQTGAQVWLRDAVAGLRVLTSQKTAFQPGDRVAVVGFPAYGADSPALEDALLRKIGTAPPPAPVRLPRPEQAFDHDDDLVTLPAQLNEIQPLLDGLTLTLENQGVIFKAILKLTTGSPPPASWQPGSRVQLTGICSVNNHDARPVMGVWHPQSFQILLRSPADLTVLEAAPWWTPRRSGFVLTGFSAALLLVAGGVFWLARHRVLEQARRRRLAEAEFAAILAERNRLAREIHDTLAQGLTATSVQLQLAKKHADNTNEPLHQHLATAQQLVRESLAEARQTIWNMRSQILETTDLPGALGDILKHLTDGTDLKTDFQVTGPPRRFAPVIENNLLRIGQEAVTNAVKHAAAQRIQMRLEFGEKAFGLTVLDDGRGFDPAQPRPSNASFGLLGMRERAIELKAELRVQSQPGQGAQITLHLPLSPD